MGFRALGFQFKVRVYKVPGSPLFHVFYYKV